MHNIKRITVRVLEKQDRFLELLAMATNQGKSVVLRDILEDAMIRNSDFIEEFLRDGNE